MGKVSLGSQAKKGSQNPVKLPPMQALKPLTEVVSVTPVHTSKPAVKKYVSPLSLSWKGRTRLSDTKEASSPPVTSKKSPENIQSDCQSPILAASNASLTLADSTSPSKKGKSLKLSDPGKSELLESNPKCSRLSEGAFNISRICVASTPIASKKTSSDGTDFIKLCPGNSDNGKMPILNSEASTISKKKKKKKPKKKWGQVPDALEDSMSSCIITSVHSPQKKRKSPNANNQKQTCSPQKETNAKQVSCDIETIDLDMTNEIMKKKDTGIELLSIKKTPPKPVEVIDFIDLSCTQNDLGKAPSGNDSVIVIDDDQPIVQTVKLAPFPVAHCRRSSLRPSKMKNTRQEQKTHSRLLKIKPHPGLIKKKEKQKNKNPKLANNLATMGQDDVCFLGTGISFRPPTSAGNAKTVVPPVSSLPSASAGSSKQNPQPVAKPSIYGNNFDNPNSNEPRKGLRPIVIDGSNVAMGHGKRDKVFSSKGIEICVNYFLKRGHKVYCFIPLFRKSDPFTRDRHILEALEEQGHLICTPSRYVGTNAIVPYDDRYIVQIAAELGGVIISRDNFRDLVAENAVFKETIQQRTLMFTWVGDILMFPNDPFGRRNVSLDSMLRF